jgi:hypothetical protein
MEIPNNKFLSLSLSMPPACKIRIQFWSLKYYSMIMRTSIAEGELHGAAAATGGAARP